jgi:hypothetical protein
MASRMRRALAFLTCHTSVPTNPSGMLHIEATLLPCFLRFGIMYEVRIPQIPQAKPRMHAFVRIQ